MRRQIYIAEEVKNQISDHIYKAVAKVIRHYMSAHEDEDTLTGQLGFALSTDPHEVFVSEQEGTWTWSITYSKLRGRGEGASEGKLGADGIFELNVDHIEGGGKKSLLFQAKNNWDKTDMDLVEQCIKLSTWREAACVLNFTPTDIEAFLIDEVIQARGKRKDINTSVPLGFLLGRTFLDCLVGDNSLSYDKYKKRLKWKSVTGEVVETQFKVGSVIGFNISSPKHHDHIKAKKEVPIEEIHNYRMEATSEEMLSLGKDYTTQDITAAYKAKAQIYHTDKTRSMNEVVQNISNRRMQEINNARNTLRSKVKKQH